MNTFEKFDEDIKMQHEFYALINYFKLLTKLQLTKSRLPLHDNIWKTAIPESDYEKFLLIDGASNLTHLLIDIEFGYIDIINYSYKELWQQLLNSTNNFNTINVSNSFSLDQAKKDMAMLIHQHNSLEKMMDSYVDIDKLNAYQLLEKQIPSMVNDENLLIDIQKKLTMKI